jgi:hypothetical protein
MMVRMILKLQGFGIKVRLDFDFFDSKIEKSSLLPLGGWEKKLRNSERMRTESSDMQIRVSQSSSAKPAA